MLESPRIPALGDAAPGRTGMCHHGADRLSIRRRESFLGALADRISRETRAVHVDGRRALIIEEDVSRRLGVAPDDPWLSRLRADYGAIAGGRRTVEIVEIRRAGEPAPFAIYGIKPSHGSEPESAERASDLGVGPRVLDVSGSAIITEEYYHRDLNVRNRKIVVEEQTRFGEYLSEFCLRFLCADEGEIFLHRDEREDHIFILGEGDDIEIRLIDWGHASTWPIGRMGEWIEDQLRWLYLELSFYRPAIWKPFIRALVERFPRENGSDSLADAYRAFARREASIRMNGWGGAPAIRFLEFSVGCGPLPMDLPCLNAFAEKARGLRGEDLMRLWNRMTH